MIKTLIIESKLFKTPYMIGMPNQQTMIKSPYGVKLTRKSLQQLSPAVIHQNISRRIENLPFGWYQVKCYS